jgi:aryl-alcohol dehydrogenase-like predicted oxidoreductase
MIRRPLGVRSGLAVSEVGLGLWAVSGSEWGAVQDEESLEAIEAALEWGVNFFDTADVYGGGHSEELLGRALRTRRDAFVVATKIGWVDFDGQANRSQYDRVDKLVAGVEESLHRLGTDRIDVIQCHVHYPEPNTQVFIEGFRRLKETGVVRAWGVSTSDPDHLRRFNADGDCDVLQTDYSILNRTAEAELFPYCQDNGIGVIVRGPLAMGLLTGKYAASNTFPEGDLRRAWIDDPGQHEQFRRDLEAVDRLRDVVPDGESMAQFALRFVMSHPALGYRADPGAQARLVALEHHHAARARAGVPPRDQRWPVRQRTLRGGRHPRGWPRPRHRIHSPDPDHGGPGGAEFGPRRRYLADLERSWLVMDWEQRGAGRSSRGDESAETLSLENAVDSQPTRSGALRPVGLPLSPLTWCA